MPAHMTAARPAPPPQGPQAHRAARARAGRRLRLDEGRRLAAGAARSVEGEGGGARASGRRERLHRGGAGRDRGPAGADVRGDEGPHQGGRRLRARARRRVRVLRRYETRRPASAPCCAGRAAAATARASCCWTRTARAEGQRLLSRSARAEHSPGPRALRLGRGRAGLGVLPHPRRDLADRRGCCPAPIENAYGDFTFSPDGAWLFWIWRDENARPSKVFRRPARRRRRRAGLRGAGRGHVPRRRPSPPTAATS